MLRPHQYLFLVGGVQSPIFLHTKEVLGVGSSPGHLRDQQDFLLYEFYQGALTLKSSYPALPNILVVFKVWNLAVLLQTTISLNRCRLSVWVVRMNLGMGPECLASMVLILNSTYVLEY